jgi:CrcB protein
VIVVTEVGGSEFFAPDRRLRSSVHTGQHYGENIVNSRISPGVSSPVSIVSDMRAEQQSSPKIGSGLAAVALVFVGGALGTLARAALLFDANSEVSHLIVLLSINTVGALVLGILTGSLHQGIITPRLNSVSRFLGTGLIGGFTSYSALALVSAEQLVSAPIVALVFGLGSVALGVVAAWTGFWSGSAAFRSMRVKESQE